MDAETRLCPWWIRWYHRRLREFDRRLMLPALREKVRVAHGEPGTFHKAWDAFKAMPGQEHWHCACAAMEFRERFDRLMEAPE